jgi:hypothetical protein
MKNQDGFICLSTDYTRIFSKILETSTTVRMGTNVLNCQHNGLEYVQ